MLMRRTISTMMKFLVAAAHDDFPTNDVGEFTTITFGGKYNLRIIKRNRDCTMSVQVDLRSSRLGNIIHTAFLDAEDLFDPESPYSKGHCIHIDKRTFSVDFSGNAGVTIGSDYIPGDIQDMESIFFQKSTVQDDIPEYSEVLGFYELMSKGISESKHMFGSITEYDDVVPFDYDEAEEELQELYNGITNLYESTKTVQ